MEVIKTKINGLYILEPKIFKDSRGHFFESFKEGTFKQLGLESNYPQDNQSLSSKGVLRGLHFQVPGIAQTKVVRVVRGSVLDVAVDIRKNSETYGQYVSVVLSGENNKMYRVYLTFYSFYRA